MYEEIGREAEMKKLTCILIVEDEEQTTRIEKVLNYDDETDGQAGEAWCFGVSIGEAICAASSVLVMADDVIRAAQCVYEEEKQGS